MGVLGREREREENKIGKKAIDRVKTDQYLRRHMLSQIIITKRLNDVVPFIRINFKYIEPVICDDISSQITL